MAFPLNVFYWRKITVFTFKLGYSTKKDFHRQFWYKMFSFANVRANEITLH